MIHIHDAYRLTALHIGPASPSAAYHGTWGISGLRAHMIHIHDAYSLTACPLGSPAGHSRPACKGAGWGLGLRKAVLTFFPPVAKLSRTTVTEGTRLGRKLKCEVQSCSPDRACHSGKAGSGDTSTVDAYALPADSSREFSARSWGAWALKTRCSGSTPDQIFNLLKSPNLVR